MQNESKLNESDRRGPCAVTGDETILACADVLMPPARVFIARSHDLAFDCGQILREALAHLGLRGGGSADLAQGDVPAKQEEALRASLTDAIRSSVHHAV